MARLTRDESEVLIRAIIDGIGEVRDNARRLIEGEAWVGLGLSSWEELCQQRFAGLFTYEVDGWWMRGLGMSQTAIAAATGVSQQAISKAAQGTTGLSPEPVKGLDGKTYGPSTLTAEVIAEAEDYVRRTSRGYKAVHARFRDRGMKQKEAQDITNRVTGRAPAVDAAGVRKGGRVKGKNAEPVTPTEHQLWRYHTAPQTAKHICGNDFNTTYRMNEFANYWKAALREGDTAWCREAEQQMTDAIVCLGRYLRIMQDEHTRDRVASGRYQVMGEAFEGTTLRAVD